MEAPEHLQIINQPHSHAEDVALFCLFPKLSIEVRLRIWYFAIDQHRLLEVKVNPPSSPNDELLYSTTNSLGRLISSRNYTAIIEGCNLYSKLLYVNRESREMALRFYRVHIPCYFRTSNKEKAEGTVKSTFYFNPDYDFLFLKLEYRSQHTIADFLYDIKAYDPKDTGLLHLALDSNAINVLHSLKTISEPLARKTFVETLQKLQDIIWVAESMVGRAILGPMDDFRDAGVRFNHSMPVKAITPTFTLLKRDPRAIGPELKYVITGSGNPRQMRVQWRQLLSKWEIEQFQPVQERVLFAVTPSNEQIYDSKTADSVLKEEEARWLQCQEKWHKIVIKYAGKVPIEGPEDLAKAVRPAIGFWLFPAEACGNLEGDVSGIKKVFDMTSHWPELALSHLS